MRQLVHGKYSPAFQPLISVRPLKRIGCSAPITGCGDYVLTERQRNKSKRMFFRIWQLVEIYGHTFTENFTDIFPNIHNTSGLLPTPTSPDEESHNVLPAVSRINHLSSAAARIQIQTKLDRSTSMNSAPLSLSGRVP